MRSLDDFSLFLFFILLFIFVCFLLFVYLFFFLFFEEEENIYYRSTVSYAVQCKYHQVNQINI